MSARGERAAAPYRRLLADVGGTHTRLAMQWPQQHPENLAILDNARYPDLVSAIASYIAGIAPTQRPRIAGIAVASPVADDHIELTNRDWHFSRTELCRQLELEALEICNDFVAVAWSLPQLEKTDYTVIGSVQPQPGDVIAVIGPGTGLGVATCVRHGEDWQVLPGEGGHVTLAAVTDAEDDIIRHLRKRFGHVSAERVLSGPGLTYLYEALAERREPGIDSPNAETIVTLASKDDALANECLSIFFALLGTVAGDLALTVGAHSVYLAGGILPRLTEELRQSQFRDRFATKGRFSASLLNIPTVLVTHPTPALVGLTVYLDRLGWT